ncbi:hypothetical protein J7L13_04030 [bacterium]|nr:hypothetical protein [bacterium]
MGKYVLNKTAYNHAKQLINKGAIDTGPWDFNWARDVKDPENFGKNYCLGHLKEGDPKTKAYWGYPFGKEGKVNRKSLASIMGYAKKNGENDIYDAAQRLAELCDEKLGKKTEIAGEFITLQSEKGVRYKHKLLGIGKYKISDSDWEVNYEYLKKLKENTEKALALGVEIPVTISHPQAPIDYTIFKVGNLVGLELTDLWLWGIFEIEDPATIEKIENGVWDKVSIAIREVEFETIHGEKIEPPWIDHVAITAINAIPDQGVFIRLERAIKKMLSSFENLLGKNKEKESKEEVKMVTQEKTKKQDEIKDTKVKELEQEIQRLRDKIKELQKREIESKVEAYIETGKLTPAVKEDAILLFQALAEDDRIITLENDKEVRLVDLLVKILDNLPINKMLEGQMIPNQRLGGVGFDEEELAKKLAGKK